MLAGENNLCGKETAEVRLAVGRRRYASTARPRIFFRDVKCTSLIPAAHATRRDVASSVGGSVCPRHARCAADAAGDELSAKDRGSRLQLHNGHAQRVGAPRGNVS